MAIGVAVIAATALLGASGAAQAEELSNASLKGVFPFNETIIAGIASFQGAGVARAITQQFSLTNQGTWGFDGQGRVHMDDTGVQVIVQGGQVSAGYSEAHCDGTYLVERDSTVSMDYVCSVPANGGQVQFDVHARGVLTPHILQVAIPPAANGKARITPMYFASSFGRTLIGCAIVGENTTVVLDRSLVPVRGRDN